MSFLDKIQFWKKKDDFSSLDFSLPPQDYSSSIPPTNTNQQEFSAQKYEIPQDPYMPQEPLQNTQNQMNANFDTQQFSTPTDSFNTQQESPFQSITPENMNEQEYGRKLAQKYASQQETINKQMQTNTSSSYTPQSEELLHLKIDAMKSEISLVNQRLQKIEHLLEAQVKQRRY